MAHIVDSTTITDTIALSEVHRPGYKVYDNDADIVGYWPMSQATCAAATDLSGNEYDLDATASTSAWPAQVGSSTIEFNRTHNTRYQLDNDDCPNLDMAGTGSFTIVAQIRDHDYISNNYYCIAMKDGQFQFEIRYDTVTRSINFLVDRTDGGYVRASGATSIEPFDWHSVAGRWYAPSSSTAGEIASYLNGELQQSWPWVCAQSTVKDSSGAFTIGEYYSGVRGFHGQMNYVALFTRALSLPELGGIAAYGIYPSGKSIVEDIGFIEEHQITRQGDIFTGFTEEMTPSDALSWAVSRKIAENIGMSDTLFGMPYEWLDAQDIGITEL